MAGRILQADTILVKSSLIIGIVCSFVYQNKVEKLALGFYNSEKQKSVDLKYCLTKCLTFYGIERKVNCYVSDNGMLRYNGSAC